MAKIKITQSDLTGYLYTWADNMDFLEFETPPTENTQRLLRLNDHDINGLKLKVKPSEYNRFLKNSNYINVITHWGQREVQAGHWSKAYYELWIHEFHQLSPMVVNKY